MQVVYENYEKWLTERKKGIGGSDASAVIGMNPYKTNIDLWEEKIGNKKPPDLSGISYVDYGHDAEPLLVKLFALDYPEYAVNYNDNYRVNYCEHYPYIYCTRDCDLTEIKSGRKGALEIKTTEITNKSQLNKWDNQIPQNYYCQVLQYFITDLEIEFVVVKAQLKLYDNKILTKHYYFERKELLSDIEFLLNKEKEFWQYVENKKRPNCILPEI